MSLRIEDYALIGNTCTAALVGRDGSIDWMCMPRFDSGACFAALLGNSDNGRWKIAPCDREASVRRAYRADTLILETEFETATGKATITDFMPISHTRDQVDVVRIVTGIAGSVDLRMEVAFRFDYGHIVPWVTQRDYGLRAIAGPDAIKLRTPVRLRGERFTTVSEFSVSQGRTIPFTLTWYPSHSDEPHEKHPIHTLAETEKWWREWAARCTIEGEWRELAIRSLITLKALTHSTTGGIVAAPTTSLPEEIGGSRNWDYRFCWLRDATFTLYALESSGYRDEARAWLQWLLRAVAGRPDQLQVLYGLAGERRQTEFSLDWLDGYENSRPVRVGNAAHDQFQLDIYGEVMDAFHVARREKLDQTDDAWRVQLAMIDFLESSWHLPDEGIWEVRGSRRQFTHSKVMSWVAVDRAVKAVERSHLEGPVDRWRRLREEIHREVCERGFSGARNAFVQSYGSEELDAAVLMIPLVGFLPADDPRMISTVDAIQRELMHDGFVKRYQSESGVDGLAPGEGIFLACSFWLVDNLAMQHRNEEALALFERLARLCNDVGLIAEEYDPVSRRMVGNFPQAFTHLALLNSLHNLTGTKGPAIRRAES